MPMTDDVQDIRDDLAFLRTLVQTGDDNLRQFGRAYLAAGVCYLAQTLLGLGQASGWIPSKGAPIGLTIGIGPTAIFLVCLVVILRRGRTKPAPGAATRAIAAMFSAVGLANLVLITVIGAVAWREKSLTIWLLYPCAVFISQGAAWLAMYSLRRRAWVALVAAVNFGSAIGMALGIDSLFVYLSVTSAGLLFGMALPGAWLMTRKSG
jgi:hypothetical protein